jgi:hypothetical protein
MVFPIHNSDIRTEIPSLPVHQVDATVSEPAMRPLLARQGVFMVYYAAIFERGGDGLRVAAKKSM